MNTPHQNKGIAEIHADQRGLAVRYRQRTIENLREYRSTGHPIHLRRARLDDAICNMWSSGMDGIVTSQCGRGGAR